MEAYLLDWANLLLRWLHLIAGIAWIGASFYFVQLDLQLEPPQDERERKDGVHGESWAVHGGGFYRKLKYQVAPPRLPATLHWFKWEAYATWLSGLGLLIVVYWLGAAIYMVDESAADLAPWATVAIGASSLVLGWFVYDALCRSTLAERGPLFAAVGFALIVLLAFVLSRLLSGRAAFIHVGAVLGTIMVANVFFVIIPGQRRMVAALSQGRTPDLADGQRGKQRSVHNNYLTLPVLLTMISGHFPMTYAHPQNWAVLALLFAAGMTVRHFYNLRHAGRDVWGLWAASAALVVLVIVVIAPAEAWRRAPAPASLADLPFDAVRGVINERCVSCHARVPTQEGIAAAPQGVMLETPQQIRRWAARINEVAVVRKTMPAGNVTEMSEEERALLARWFAAGAPVE